MKNAKDILAGLKAEGGKTTKVRTAVVEAFVRHAAPMTALELADLLAAKGIRPNKTTLYRELSFLVGKDVVREIAFGDRTSRYEIAGDHHHHVVCVRCDRVVDVALDNDLDAEERAIARKTKFAILRHSLEFFGLCASCR